MKRIFSTFMLVLAFTSTTAKAQSHFNTLDYVNIVFASLDTKESFICSLVPDFKKDNKANLIEEPSSVVLMNLAPSLNVTDWTALYKKQTTADASLKINTAPSPIKNADTAKFDFLGYPLSPLTARQPSFEEPELISNTILVYIF